MGRTDQDMPGEDGGDGDKGMVDKKEQGRKNRKSGVAFELKVRKDMEKQGWIVSKWTNNVSDYPEGNINLPTEQREDRKLIPAKRKYNPFMKALSIGVGFPDFIAYQEMKSMNEIAPYQIVGVEVKSNGKLDKGEKEKCRWLLENRIFSNIVIASKGEKRGEIIYTEFQNI